MAITFVVALLAAAAAACLCLGRLAEIQKCLRGVKANEERLNLALDAADIGIFDWDVPTGAFYFSPQYPRILGYADDEFPKILADRKGLIHPDDFDETQSIIFRSLESGQDSYTIEYRMRSKSGTWEWIMAKGKVVRRSDEGKPLRVIGTHTNITGRKIMEEALRLSEEKYRLFAENISDVIWTMDLDLHFTYISPSAERLAGYTSEELLETPSTEYRAAEDIDASTKVYREMIASAYELPSSAVIERRLVNSMHRKDGSTLWVEINARLLRDTKGNPTGILGITRDITQRKLAEDEIRYLSYHDRLTGLYNRLYAENEINRLDSGNELPLSIVIGDVNGLKLTNDTFGHPAGDELLKNIAEVLRESVGDRGVIARWGGDEFVILLPGLDAGSAAEICSAIRLSCKRRRQSKIPLSMALGVACKSDAGTPADSCLREAEECMYRNKLVEGKSARNAIISSLRRTLGEKTRETEEHSLRLQELVKKFAGYLNLSNSQADDLMLLSVLHDIGNIGIPDSILAKPGPLSPDEWPVIKTHTEIGYRIAMSTFELSHIAHGILAHHERWDGTGYPHGLKGEEIPLISRILSLLDAYDVMTNSRPYGKTMTRTEALEEIARCSSKQFDPQLVRRFADMMKDSDLR